MSYDAEVVVVGGGVAGASLAKALCDQGIDVIVIEREARFRDRVRGEALVPWGVVEGRRLELSHVLEGAVTMPVRYWSHRFGGVAYRRQDLEAEPPARSGCRTFYHPALQEALLLEAEAAGARVLRGASVLSVAPGPDPVTSLRTAGAVRELRARLVVGADGRGSRVRQWLGLSSERDPESLRVSGVLLEGMNIADTDVLDVVNPGLCRHVIVFPQGEGRGRAYLSVHKDVDGRTFSGDARLPAFIAASVEAGADPSWYAGAKAKGPLATYSGAHDFVRAPFRAGVVLVGDAAGSSDPSWGQGLSLALRDVRLLRDALVGGSDWSVAVKDYAEAHAVGFTRMRTFELWFEDLFMNPAPAAAERLQRCVPLYMQDISRVPECFTALGPDLEPTEELRHRFYGE